MFRKRKVRGLFGYWNEALYSIDIDYFESFLKQQKKDTKSSSKSSSPSAASASASASTATANGADSGDTDEEVPDVDPTHEQLNLPQNSITLWKILPRLEYASQVFFSSTVLKSNQKLKSFPIFIHSSFTTFRCLQWH